jgi:phosphopantothenoylcysteine decarboxylase
MDEEDSDMAHIAVGVTGSVAAIRVPMLVAALRAGGHDARVVTTEPALYFFDPGELPPPIEDAGPPLGRAALFRDADEWPRRSAPAPGSWLLAPGGDAAGGPASAEPGSRRQEPGAASTASMGVYQRDDPVLHIELRRWADLLVIAPLDANTLAKLAYGLSDNLLTCLYRAWDRRRPIVLAPAMNTFMWESPLTGRHLRLLLEEHGEGAAPARVGSTSSPPPAGTRPPAGTPLDEVIAAINRDCPRLRVCPPQSKRLACGDEGMGAMADVGAIAAAVAEKLGA